MLGYNFNNPTPISTAPFFNNSSGTEQQIESVKTDLNHVEVSGKFSAAVQRIGGYSCTVTSQ